MSDLALLRLANAELDALLAVLELDFVSLSECLVSRGWRMTLRGPQVTGIHYNLGGHGWLITEGRPRIELKPHMLVILPAGAGITIEAPANGQSTAQSVVIQGEDDNQPVTVKRHVAGDATPEIILICGYFRATYGLGIDLFSALASPIVEQFTERDQLDQALQLALAELVAQEVGYGAMTAALLKQVLVLLLRRSRQSIDLWAERFSLFSDPRIARVFADMARRPGAPHSLISLAETAGLSRSAFAARFAAIFGAGPMTILRRLRLRQASSLLTGKTLTVDQIAAAVGYASRSSFVRAFREAYGEDPSAYRHTALLGAKVPSESGV